MEYIKPPISQMVQMINIVFFQAQRNNEDVEAIKPLFFVNVEHRVSNVVLFVFNGHTSIVVPMLKPPFD